MADPQREPAPEQIRMQDIRAELEKAFPGATVDLNHGIQSHSAEIRFDEFELRVLLSGPAGEKHKALNVRFLQRIEKGKMRVFFDRHIGREPPPAGVDKSTADWYALQDAIGDARAHVRGLVHALTTVLTPKRPKEYGSIHDLLTGGD